MLKLLRSLCISAAVMLGAFVAIFGQADSITAASQKGTPAGVSTPVVEPVATFRHFDRLLALVTVVLVLGQLFLGWRQTQIADRQAEIMHQQTLITSRQTDIAAQERQLNTRPNISSEVIYDGTLEQPRQYWRVRNDGPFAVDNVRVRYLRFLRYPSHGWQVRNQAFLVKPDGLSPKETWAVDLTARRDNFVEDAAEPPPGLNSDYLVLLLFFERRVDGRPYVLLEPLYSVGNGTFSTMSLNTGGGVGPMDFHRNVAVELTFEFFKRHPLDRKYELYNFEYLLGYESKGDLGPLDWTSDIAGRWP